MKLIPMKPGPPQEISGSFIVSRSADHFGIKNGEKGIINRRGETMQTKEIRIGQAIYELHRVYSSKGTVTELIREKLEADAAAIDAEKRKAV